ncbi:unnamed protein product [Lota lota]
MDENLDAQHDELLALGSIFGPDVFLRATDGTPSAAAGEMRVSVELPQDFFVAVEDGDAFVYFGISSLPPLSLRFELPEEYPSSSPPTFTLSCSWLTNAQICALDTHLADLYHATGGAVVLFSWVQFLKEDTLSILNINSLLVLPSDVNSPPRPYRSGSSGNGPTPPVPNPGRDRTEARAETDDRNPVVSAACEGEAPLNVGPLIDGLPDEEEPSDGVGRAAPIVESHDEEEEEEEEEEDAAPLSSKSPHGGRASNQSTSKRVPANLDGSSSGAAPGVLGVSDPGSCEHPCSSSPSPPPPPPPPPPAPAPPPTPPRRASSAQTLLSLILVHDEAQKRRRFAESVLQCGVCLAPVPGSKCMQLRECDHVHCEPCLARYCAVLISEGNVRGIACPQPRCKAAPTPTQVRKLVGDDLFHRYDRLLFQTSLDSMTDVVYCPRVSCASAVILEPDSDVAQCSVCGFAFCVSCRRSYHGTGRCPRVATARQTDAQEEQDYVDLPQTLVGLMALWDDYYRGSAQRKKLLEKRYSAHILRSTMSEYLTMSWCLNNQTQNCPHCGATIQVVLVVVVVVAVVVAVVAAAVVVAEDGAVSGIV